MGLDCVSLFAVGDHAQEPGPGVGRASAQEQVALLLPVQGLWPVRDGL